MTTINIRSNLREVERSLSAFAYKQVPFAQALALSALAKRVAEDEQANETKVLDRPRPFTLDAIGTTRATKGSQESTVYMKDIAARYLEPYEFGGSNVLNSKALLVPIDAAKDLDAYGNLPRNFLKKLKGRSDIFIGIVKTPRGPVNGVWQRTTDVGGVVNVKRQKGGTLKVGRTRKGLNTSGKLHLLVKFEDAHPVKQRLDWFGVAKRTIDREFQQQFEWALAKAISSAK